MVNATRSRPSQSRAVRSNKCRRSLIAVCRARGHPHEKRRSQKNTFFHRRCVSRIARINAISKRHTVFANVTGTAEREVCRSGTRRFVQRDVFKKGNYSGFVIWRPWRAQSGNYRLGRGAQEQPEQQGSALPPRDPVIGHPCFSGSGLFAARA